MAFGSGIEMPTYRRRESIRDSAPNPTPLEGAVLAMMGTRFPRPASLAVLIPALLFSSCALVSPRSSYGLSSDVVATPSTPAPSLAMARPAPQDDDQRVFGDMRWPGMDAAESIDTFNALGLVLSASVTAGEILGDLDGTTAVVDDVMTPTQFVFLPDIDATAGFALAISNRWKEWEIGVGYGRTDFDASFGGVPMDTLIETIDLNVKRFYRVDQNIQPYLLVGIGWAKGVIEDGALDASGVQDAKLKDGINFNIGVGASLFTTPWLSFFGQAVWRFGRYDSVDGTFGTSLVSGTIDSDSYEISGGVAFRIMRERNTD